MICFHFSIFEPLETAGVLLPLRVYRLWFAFILVSLNHWKQRGLKESKGINVVICFHFSIFEPLETAQIKSTMSNKLLWFAFILVSLNHWKQLYNYFDIQVFVVICFHFSIFEPLETAADELTWRPKLLWFAFILVSLNHWKQLIK